MEAVYDQCPAILDQYESERAISGRCTGTLTNYRTFSKPRFMLQSPLVIRRPGVVVGEDKMGIEGTKFILSRRDSLVRGGICGRW
jgi:hypothetical protein